MNEMTGHVTQLNACHSLSHRQLDSDGGHLVYSGGGGSSS